MELKSAEVELITNKTITSDNLQAFCDEVRQRDHSKVGDRICEEVSAVVKEHMAQTISWSQIIVDTISPAFIDRLVFHELGRFVHIDRKEFLFGEQQLIRRLNEQDLESKYSGSDGWMDWQPKVIAGDEYWEYEKSYGPPEWGIGKGIALVRNGQIVEYHQTECSF